MQVFPRSKNFHRHRSLPRPSRITVMASDSPAQPLLERVQGFVSEHKHAILVGAAAAALAAGGVAYYASTSRRARAPDGDDPEKGEHKPKDKKKGKSLKKRKSGKDKDGPILEERKPDVIDDAGEGVVLMCRTLSVNFLTRRR